MEAPAMYDQDQSAIPMGTSPGGSLRAIGSLLVVITTGCGPQTVRTDPLSVRAVPQANSPAADARQAAGAEPGRQLDSPAGDRDNSIPRVPASSLLAPQSVAADQYHTVEQGDTLSAIARRYAVTVESLTRENGLSETAVLQPGQMLFIPASRTER